MSRGAGLISERVLFAVAALGKESTADAIYEESGRVDNQASFNTTLRDMAVNKGTLYRRKPDPSHPYVYGLPAWKPELSLKPKPADVDKAAARLDAAIQQIPRKQPAIQTELRVNGVPVGKSPDEDDVVVDEHTKAVVRDIQRLGAEPPEPTSADEQEFLDLARQAKEQVELEEGALQVEVGDSIPVLNPGIYLVRSDGVPYLVNVGHGKITVHQIEA